jgi:hypothetical protein
VNRIFVVILLGASLGQASAFGAEPPVRAQTQAAPAPAAASDNAGAATDAGAVEPAVQTSSAANAPARDSGKGKGQSASGKPATASHAHDSIDLEATQITGNRELPNVMYVVPWKKPDLGDFAGRPPKSLLDEMLAPVDREVFQRQNRYFAALQPDAAAGGAARAAPGAKPAAPAAPAAAPAAPASGPVPGPGSGDEK